MDAAPMSLLPTTRALNEEKKLGSAATVAAVEGATPQRSIGSRGLTDSAILILTRLWRAESACGIYSSCHDVHKLPDLNLKTILIAPVFALRNLAEFPVVRTIESVFDIVVPNDRPANHCHCPEAVSRLAIWVLLPFFRMKTDCIPKPSFKRIHTLS